MIRGLLEQVIEREGFTDEVILYYNEDNLIETGNGGALKFMLETTNPSLMDNIGDVLEMEFSIIDWMDLNSNISLITIDSYI